MRRIDTIREAFFENVGDGPAVVVRLRDWRKIRRVLRAAEVWKDDRVSLRGSVKLHEAVDALNREPKK